MVHTTGENAVNAANAAASTIGTVAEYATGSNYTTTNSPASATQPSATTAVTTCAKPSVEAVVTKITQNIAMYVTSFYNRSKGSAITEEVMDGMLMRLQKICIESMKD